MTRFDEGEIRSLVAKVVAELGGTADSAAAAGPTASAAPASPSPSGASSASRPVSGRRLAIGADHGGFALKQRLVAHLGQAGWQVVDCGTTSSEACDYPDFAHAVAQAVASGAAELGIVVDGAGIGSSMVANKVPGVRASLCYDLSSARNAREHNHANVLTLGAGLVGEALAVAIVDTWLATPWGGERHARRVAKIMEVEARYVVPKP